MVSLLCNSGVYPTDFLVNFRRLVKNEHLRVRRDQVSGYLDRHSRADNLVKRPCLFIQDIGIYHHLRYQSCQNVRDTRAVSSYQLEISYLFKETDEVVPRANW